MANEYRFMAEVVVSTEDPEDLSWQTQITKRDLLNAINRKLKKGVSLSVTVYENGVRSGTAGSGPDPAEPRKFLEYELYDEED